MPMTYQTDTLALTALAAALLDLAKEVRLARLDGRTVLTTGEHTVIYDGRNFFIMEELGGTGWHFVSPSALEVAETIRAFDDDDQG